jgi:hypothetical protein
MRHAPLAAAALVLIALPAVGHADGFDRGRSRAVPVVPAPRPPDPRDALRPGDPLRRVDGRGARASWRIRELGEVNRALRCLQLERRRFHAFPHTRREVRRFERWYTSRLAELEDRRDALQAYAWR